MSENKKRKKKVTAIPKAVPHGLVLWQLNSGMYLGNESGEYLSVGVHMGDLAQVKIRVQRLKDAAKAMGFEDGKPVFRPGTQKVTLSEYEDQMAQLLDGEEIEGDLDVY